MNVIEFIPFIAAAAFVAAGINAMVALRRLAKSFERLATPEECRRFLWDYVDFKAIQVWTLFNGNFRKVCLQYPEVESARTSSIRAMVLIPGVQVISIGIFALLMLFGA